MGYFDYVDEKTDAQKELRVYNYLSKFSFWFSMASLLFIIISAVMFIFIVKMGSAIWSSAFPLVGVVLAVVGIVYAQKSRSIMKKNHVVHPFTNMSRALNVLFGFINLILTVVNILFYI